MTTIGEILGKERAVEIVKRAQKEGREAFNAARSRAKDGDERLPYTKRQHQAITTTLRALRSQQDLDRAALGALIADLQKRIAELEARPTVRYCGVWDEKTSYGIGALVTFGGSVWHANVVTAPGRKPNDETEPRQWQLAVKKGRDGRDD